MEGATNRLLDMARRRLGDLNSVGGSVPVAASEPTYFGTTSSCVDECSESVSPTAVTPPSDMVAGDLVIMFGAARTDPITIAVSETGGQSWTTEGAYRYIGTLAWCTFDGTWDASPSMTISDVTNGFSVIMIVFRPATTPHTWQKDAGGAYAGYSAPSDPFDVTISSWNTTNGNAVALDIWQANDDVTWTLQTAGWTNAGTSQYRNIYGGDSSYSFAYKIMSGAGAVGDSVNRQGDVAGDNGGYATISFY